MVKFIKKFPLTIPSLGEDEVSAVAEAMMDTTAFKRSETVSK